jgi:hypothetical protein
MKKFIKRKEKCCQQYLRKGKACKSCPLYK